MFNSSCMKKFFLIALCSVSITNLFAEPNNQDIDSILAQLSPEEQAQFQEAIQQEIENMLQQRLDSLDTLDMILESISIEVDKNIILTRNKNDTINNIRTWRQAINTFKECTLIEVEPYTLHALDSLTHATAKALYTAIQNGFTEFHKFDIKSIKTRAPQEITDFEQLQQEFTDNKELIQIIEDMSTNVGLTWYNKAYRKLDDKIIEPSLKYSIPSRAIKVGMIAAIPLYLLYRAGHPFCTKLFGRPYHPLQQNNIPSFSEHLCTDVQFNATPEQMRYLAHHAENFDVNSGLGVLGKTESVLHSFSAGTMALGLVCWPYIKEFWQKELRVIREGITKKVTIAHNKLKGGVYRKKARDLEDIIPDVTFEDVIGLEHEKEVLKMVIKYVENNKKFDRGGLVPQKGYLLTGPTRTGKSFLAKALCGEIKEALARQGCTESEFKFMEIKVSTINEMGITEVLRIAKYAAPCVLFIDEIDMLDLQKTRDTRKLSEFLTALSGALEDDPKKQVIIIATTNNPENMDHRLRQPGRFGVELRFEYPGVAHRKLYFERRLSKLAIDPIKFDLDKLALETEGCSYEALEMLLISALQVAKVRGAVLSQALLEQSLDRTIRNIMPLDGKDLPESERRIIAAQQAGLAFAHILLDSSAKVAKVTTCPVMVKQKEQMVGLDLFDESKVVDNSGKEYGKLFVYHEKDTVKFNTREQKIVEIKLKLAGNIAEKVLMGSCGFTYKASHKKEAYELACQLMLEGIDVKSLSKRTKQELLDQAYQLVKTCEQEVLELFEQNGEKLQALMDALLEKQILTAREVYAVIGQEIDTQFDQANTHQAIRDLGIPEEPAESAA